jgi:hypothetical protein
VVESWCFGGTWFLRRWFVVDAVRKGPLVYLILWSLFKSVEICRALLSFCWCPNLLRFAGFKLTGLPLSYWC